MLEMKEIKSWEKVAIDAKVTELRTELFNLRMQKSASGIEKPHMIKDLKKDVARLMTAKNMKGEK